METENTEVTSKFSSMTFFGERLTKNFPISFTRCGLAKIRA